MKKIKCLEVSFIVLNKKWILRWYTKKGYRKKNGKDSVAITKLHVRRVELSPKGFDLETIVHELTHCYLYEMCIHSADIDGRSLEEVFAELMAKRGYELLALAEKLQKVVSGTL